MDLPIYKIDINKLEHGVDKISLVENPAIEEHFLKFSLDNTNYNFTLANEDQQKLIGALLIPNKPIYRFDEDLGEYYVVFEEDVIEEIAKRYNKNGFATSFNTEHNKDVSDVILQENWIVEDSKFDKSAAYGLEYPKGTWVGVAKIEEQELWEQVKQDFNGFSVELLSGLKLSKEEPKPTDKEMLDWLADKGEDEEELLKEWEVVEESEDLESDFAIVANTNEPSKYDNENFKTRYKYTGGNVKDNTREFCREMLTTHKRKLFRYEDINQMSFNRENEDFGFYSIWKWKGSFNCRHRWKKILMRKKGSDSTQKPPSPPNESLAETRQNKNSAQAHNQIKMNKLTVKIELEAAATLEDGTEVFTPTELVEGAILYIGTDEGGEFAPAGSHTLENGTVVTVGKEGVIESISTPEAEAENQEELSDSLLAKITEIVESAVAKTELSEDKIKEVVKSTLSEVTPAEENVKNDFENKKTGFGIIPQLPQK